MHISLDISMNASHGASMEFHIPLGDYTHGKTGKVVKAIYGYTVEVTPRFALLQVDDEMIVLHKHEKPMVREIGIDGLKIEDF